MSVSVGSITYELQLDTASLRRDLTMQERAMRSSAQAIERAFEHTSREVNDALKSTTRTAARAAGETEREFESAARGMSNATQTATRRMNADLRSVGDRGSRVAGGLRRAFSTAFKPLMIGGALAMTGGVIAAGAAARGAVASVELASGREQARGATDAVFGGEAAADMKRWAEGMSRWGLSTQEALEGGNLLGTLLINKGGFSQERAVGEVQDLSMLATDLAAMWGTTTGESVDKIISGMKGEFNPLEGVGVTMTAAMIEAEAVAAGAKNKSSDGGEDVTDGEKTEAYLRLLYQQTKASQGQAKREENSYESRKNRLKAEARNLGANLGQAMMPGFTRVLESLSSVMPALQRGVESLTPILERSADALSRFISGNITENAVDDIVTKIHEGFEWLVMKVAELKVFWNENGEEIVATLERMAEVAKVWLEAYSPLIPIMETLTDLFLDMPGWMQVLTVAVITFRGAIFGMVSFLITQARLAQINAATSAAAAGGGTAAAAGGAAGWASKAKGVAKFAGKAVLPVTMAGTALWQNWTNSDEIGRLAKGQDGGEGSVGSQLSVVAQNSFIQGMRPIADMWDLIPGVDTKGAMDRLLDDERASLAAYERKQADKQAIKSASYGKERAMANRAGVEPNQWGAFPQKRNNGITVKNMTVNGANPREWAATMRAKERQKGQRGG